MHYGNITSACLHILSEKKLFSEFCKHWYLYSTPILLMRELKLLCAKVKSKLTICVWCRREIKFATVASCSLLRLVEYKRHWLITCHCWFICWRHPFRFGPHNRYLKIFLGFYQSVQENVGVVLPANTRTFPAFFSFVIDHHQTIDAV